MRPRLPHTNKHSERSNVGRVETTNMLYIAGYQETWMLLRSSYFKKAQPERAHESPTGDRGYQAGLD